MAAKNIFFVFGKRLVAECIAVDPDRSGFLDHFVAEHIGQERGAGGFDQGSVDLHNLGCRAYLDPLGRIINFVRAIQDRFVTGNNMRFQAKLV